jgi:hypothetical protein
MIKKRRNLVPLKDIRLRKTLVVLLTAAVGYWLGKVDPLIIDAVANFLLQL